MEIALETAEHDLQGSRRPKILSVYVSTYSEHKLNLKSIIKLNEKGLKDFIYIHTYIHTVNRKTV